MTHMIHETVVIVMMETAPSFCPLSNAFGACDQSAPREHVAGWYRWLRQAEFNQTRRLHLQVYGLPGGGHQTVPQTGI